MSTEAAAVHPSRVLADKAAELGVAITDLKLARSLDEDDPVGQLRAQFHYPRMKELPHVDMGLVDDPESECVYLCGNSLGLLPRGVQAQVERELQKWASMGVYGHKQGVMPWVHCDECIEDQMASIVGGKRDEVAVMNSLSVNIHVLLATFYQPTAKRHKIIITDKTFPSDHYAVESEIKLKGRDPLTSMILLKPRQGEHCLRPEDILSTIETEGESVAIIWLEGVHYYTGQLLDMAAITRAGHDQGILVGFDLAHAVGNVPLYLHDWDVDFAAWCTYKYLNAGAGSIGGAFVHERLAGTYEPALTGWWGHDYATRFAMTNRMEAAKGIHALKISNPSGLLCASLQAALNVYAMTDMETLRAKSVLLTGYMELLVRHCFSRSESRHSSVCVDVYTPSDVRQRGCQLSLRFSVPVQEIYSLLTKRGVVCDLRQPDIIRVCPVHLYCSFEDVYRFVTITAAILEELESGSGSMPSSSSSSLSST